MTKALQFISNNSLASTLAAAVILAIVSGIWKWHRDHRDSKKIYDFMMKSKTETDYVFRSTEAISSHTKISENRVAELCSKHPKIKRNEKEKQSWRVVD
jgi:prenyltransferase beta subunit